MDLGRDDVHVWRATLLPPPRDLRFFESVLSPDELSRAEKFRFPDGRENYIMGKAILRILLARYAGMEPASLRFIHGRFGKPYLPDGHPIMFNMSDSHGLALFAFSLNREVGVDLERIRHDTPCDRIARRHFTPAEADQIATLPVPQKTQAFFTAWAGKEAFLKAIGTGLYRSMNSFEVPLTADAAPARELSQFTNLNWSLNPLCPSNDYAAVVAVEGESPILSCFDWN